MRAIGALADVPVGGDADHQDVGLGLGVGQVAHMAGMHHVEHAVAHHHRRLARIGADARLQRVPVDHLVGVALEEFGAQAVGSGFR